MWKRWMFNVYLWLFGEALPGQGHQLLLAGGHFVLGIGGESHAGDVISGRLGVVQGGRGLLGKFCRNVCCRKV